MLATLTVVLPIFALVFVGWLARRIGVLGPHATTELSRFVLYLALPALLLDVVAHAQWSAVWQPGFAAAFGLGAAITFGLAMALRLRARPLADATIDGLNASYSNTGFVGFPLVLAVLGRDALAPTLVASIITVCVQFAVAIALIEVGLLSAQGRLRLAAKVGRALALNPLLIAPALGALFPLTGLPLPDFAGSLLKLLGASAAPCALIALGLFLAAEREAGEQDLNAAALLTGGKLVLQPAVTWVLASAVFGLSPLLTHTAVLLAALPTGTGPFMLAESYRREASLTGRVLLASTVASVLTLSGYIALAV